MRPTLCSRKVFGVQLYKNNARVLLSHIFSILNSDWPQHVHSSGSGSGSYCAITKTVIIHRSVWKCRKLIFKVSFIHQSFKVHSSVRIVYE